MDSKGSAGQLHFYRPWAAGPVVALLSWPLRFSCHSDPCVSQPLFWNPRETSSGLSAPSCSFSRSWHLTPCVQCSLRCLLLCLPFHSHSLGITEILTRISCFSGFGACSKRILCFFVDILTFDSVLSKDKKVAICS